MSAVHTGTVLVMLSDRSHDSSSGTAAADGRVLGDLVCILSALCYASYTVVLRRQLPNDDEADVALFFGYVGLFSTLAFAPVVGIMLLRGTWSLTMTSKETYLLILIEGEHVCSDAGRRCIHTLCEVLLDMCLTSLHHHSDSMLGSRVHILLVRLSTACILLSAMQACSITF